MKSIRGFVVVTTVLLSATLAFAQIDSNIAVGNYAQSRGQPCASRGAVGCGGCYAAPTPFGDPTTELYKVNSEWAPIGPMISSGFGSDLTFPPDSAPVLINGTVALSIPG